MEENGGGRGDQAKCGEEKTLRERREGMRRERRYGEGREIGGRRCEDGKEAGGRVE